MLYNLLLKVCTLEEETCRPAPVLPQVPPCHRILVSSERDSSNWR